MDTAKEDEQQRVHFCLLNWYFSMLVQRDADHSVLWP